MTLTTVLKDRHHPVTSLVYKWMRPELPQIVDGINQSVVGLQPLKGGDFDRLLFPEIGTAMTYAIKDYLIGFARNPDCLAQTIAGIVAKEHDVFSQLVEVLATNHPFRYLALAELEKQYRCGDFQLLRNGMQLPPDLEQTANDINLLVSVIPEYMGKLKARNDVSIQLFPRFYGSRYIPADAQMIIGQTLVDIKTSLKRKPITTESIVQQVAYVGFDCDNRYEFKQVVWILPRHQAIVAVPLEKLISCPKEQFQKAMMLDLEICENDFLPWIENDFLFSNVDF